MRNLYLLLFLQHVLSIFNLYLFKKNKTKIFFDFINDDSVKDNNVTIIKKENEGYKNKINELENEIKN